MKWVSCICENGVKLGHFSHLKVAVKTAPKHLDAICIYQGTDPTVVGWLEANNVKVIQHTLSCKTMVREKYGRDWAVGAFLRIDVPVICQQLFSDKFVLYTDCDVMFLGTLEKVADFKPEFLAASMEFSNWQYFNSGIMIYNVDRMAATHDEFVKYVAENTDLGTSTDQHVLNKFYTKWDRLPVEYNWKPYWGVGENVEILHFHGPKPDIPFSIRDEVPFNRTLMKEGYDYYAKIFHEKQREIARRSSESC